MYIGKSWHLLLAVAVCAAVGAAVAPRLRRRQRLIERHPEHASDLKSWENEGGNVVPIAATAVPAVTQGAC